MLKKIIALLFVLYSFGNEKAYVTAHLYGQLGNQLFQIAAATSLALDHGAEFIFPDLNLSHDNIPINREHVFHRFDNKNSKAPLNFEYVQKNFSFDPILYIPNMVLNGYFQSEKFFIHHKKEILDLFAPSDEIISYLTKKYNYIINHPKTVSLHLRFYRDTTPDNHKFVGFDYVKKAVTYFDKDSIFIVFSDQIELCKKKLKMILPNRRLIFIEGNKHYQDLYLISLCKNNIISNSSFSWWGAYLNKNPEKIVITPSPNQWFGKSLFYLNTKDLLPPDWISISGPF